MVVNQLLIHLGLTPIKIFEKSQEPKIPGRDLASEETPNSGYKTRDNIFSQIPPNRPIRVLIKYINQAVWHEVIPISQYSLSNLYYFGFNSNNSNTTFWMYSDYGENNFFDVRIMF